MLLKYEIQLYKVLMIYKRRVFEIDKLQAPNKTDALLNAYLIYDVSVKIINFKDAHRYMDELYERHLKRLSELKSSLMKQKSQFKQTEMEFKNANRN